MESLKIIQYFIKNSIMLLALLYDDLCVGVGAYKTSTVSSSSSNFVSISKKHISGYIKLPGKGCLRDPCETVIHLPLSKGK